MAKPKFDDEGKMTNKDALIKAEIKNLKAVYEGLSKERFDLALPLIQSAAFQYVSMIELEHILKEKGFVEEYKNGENQFGLKESSESKSYISLAKTHLAYRKQLDDMLAKETKAPEKSGEEFTFTDFVTARNDE